MYYWSIVMTTLHGEKALCDSTMHTFACHFNRICERHPDYPDYMWQLFSISQIDKINDCPPEQALFQLLYSLSLHTINHLDEILIFSCWWSSQSKIFESTVLMPPSGIQLEGYSTFIWLTRRLLHCSAYGSNAVRMPTPAFLSCSGCVHLNWNMFSMPLLLPDKNELYIEVWFKIPTCSMGFNGLLFLSAYVACLL